METSFPVCESVGMVDDDMRCVMCQDSWKKPVAAKPCDHIFCRGCVENMYDCPQCRAPIVEFQLVHRVLVGVSEKVSVKCTDCEKVMARSESYAHNCAPKVKAKPVEQPRPTRDEPPAPPAPQPQEASASTTLAAPGDNTGHGASRIAAASVTTALAAVTRQQVRTVTGPRQSGLQVAKLAWSEDSIARSVQPKAAVTSAATVTATEAKRQTCALETLGCCATCASSESRVAPCAVTPYCRLHKTFVQPTDADDHRKCASYIPRSVKCPSGAHCLNGSAADPTQQQQQHLYLVGPMLSTVLGSRCDAKFGKYCAGPFIQMDACRHRYCLTCFGQYIARLATSKLVTPERLLQFFRPEPHIDAYGHCALRCPLCRGFGRNVVESGFVEFGWVFVTNQAQVYRHTLTQYAKDTKSKIIDTGCCAACGVATDAIGTCPRCQRKVCTQCHLPAQLCLHAAMDEGRAADVTVFGDTLHRFLSTFGATRCATCKHRVRIAPTPAKTNRTMVDEWTPADLLAPCYQCGVDVCGVCGAHGWADCGHAVSTIALARECLEVERGESAVPQRAYPDIEAAVAAFRGLILARTFMSYHMPDDLDRVSIVSGIEAQLAKLAFPVGDAVRMSVDADTTLDELRSDPLLAKLGIFDESRQRELWQQLIRPSGQLAPGLAVSLVMRDETLEKFSLVVAYGESQLRDNRDW
jgi:hypothetical protein